METLPVDEELQQMQQKSGSNAPGGSDLAAHASLNQYIKNIVDKLTLKKDISGKLIIDFPHQKMPMRTYIINNNLINILNKLLRAIQLKMSIPISVNDVERFRPN